eukprot:369478_1
MNQKYNIFRGKGFLWIAHENDQMLAWNQAGKVTNIENEGPWFCVEMEEHTDMSDGEHKDNEHEHEYTFDPKVFFKGKWGDRRQQIVFIGQNINKDELVKELDVCLLTDDEMKLTPKGWA